MSDIKKIVDDGAGFTSGGIRFEPPNKDRHNERVYLGGKSRPYGLHPTDIFNLDYYLAATILNGLRMIMSEGHHYYDAEMETVAAKLEFYIGDFDSVIDEHIDFSQDRPYAEDFTEDISDWLSHDGRPGQKESYDKWLIVDQMRLVYIKEAMEWLGANWGTLWD